MIRIDRIKWLLSFSLFLISITACKPDYEIFEKDEDLAGTVYFQLESMDEFNYYLESLDRTAYAEALRRSGSWTVFVPNDSVFEIFLKENDYSSIEEIPQKRIQDIIKYSIITDAYNSTTLSYTPSQMYDGASCRRLTQYKDTLAEIDSKDYPHFIDWEDRTYLVDKSFNQYRTTNYFLQSNFDYRGFQPSDYDFMFPGEHYEKNDIKVFDTHVLERNVVAENGMIFVQDKVIEPLSNLYVNLSSTAYQDKYSLFRQLLERFGYFDFWQVQENPKTGSMDSIFRINFLTGIGLDYLPFNPNSESYPAISSGGSQTLARAPVLMAPTNEVLTRYLQDGSILGDYYDSYDEMPLDVLGKFLSMNFFSDFFKVCPSNFANIFTIGLEQVYLNESDIVFSNSV